MASSEIRIDITNKSASVSTVTYTNWSASTSRSIVVPPGAYMKFYNYHEPNDAGVETATTDNIFNLPVENATTTCLIQDFAYDKSKVAVQIRNV
jgi:hypothetical protein